VKQHWSHTLVPAVILLGPEPDEAEVPLEPWIPTPLAPSATLVTDTFPFIPFALVALCEMLSVPFGSDEGWVLADCWVAVVECLMGVEVMMAEPTEVVEFRVMFWAYILFGVVVLCT